MKFIRSKIGNFPAIDMVFSNNLLLYPQWDEPNKKSEHFEELYTFYKLNGKITSCCYKALTNKKNYKTNL